MLRPKVTPENGPAVYDFYLDHPAKYAGIGQLGMSMIWRPRTIWAPGVGEATQEHLEAGKALLWTANHGNIHDQNIIAATGRRESALHSTRNNYYVVVKPDLVQINIVLRYLVDAMGSIPGFRYKDFLDKDGNPNQRLLTYQEGLRERFYETTVERSERGQLGFMFSQGERDLEETGKVDKIKIGIGEIATRIDSELDPAILVSGFHYPTFKGTDRKNRLRPTMVMGALMTDLPDDPREITEIIAPTMQNAINWAEELTPKRIYV